MQRTKGGAWLSRSLNQLQEPTCYGDYTKAKLRPKSVVEFLSSSFSILALNLLVLDLEGQVVQQKICLLAEEILLFKGLNRLHEF